MDLNFNHRQLQISYKEVTKIYNEANYSNNISNNYKEISKKFQLSTKDNKEA